MAPARPGPVLHYTGAADDAGGIVSVVRALAGAGRFECILGLSAGGVQRRTPRLPVLEWPPLAAEKIGLRTWWRAGVVARAVRGWLAEDPARIFHGHSRAGLLVALRLRARGESRVVASVHCYGRQRWFYRAAARRLGSRLFWLSPAMRAYYGLPDRGWDQCIPGGAPRAAVRRGPAASGCLRLAGVGMLVRWKRWDLVLRALARLPAPLCSQVTFTHIGGGDDALADELRRTAHDLGVADRARFLGPRPSPDDLWRDADVLVVASDREPFSMAMLEALAAGVPVLAADSGGAVDVIRPEENGWLFRSGDTADLAARIASLAARPERPASGPDLPARFTAEGAAEAWSRVYRAVVGP